MSCDSTPKPKNSSEVWNYVTPDRLANYMHTKTSASMMDHYYDKLLHIALFNTEVVQNKYLEETAAHRVQPLLDICIAYGSSGIVPIEMIKSHII